jgi:hypothetical protein
VLTLDDQLIYTTYDHDNGTKHAKHSQLGGGARVVCAGELTVGHVWDHGPSVAVTMLSDASGHYKPDGRVCLGRVVERLEAMGVPMALEGECRPKKGV